MIDNFDTRRLCINLIVEDLIHASDKMEMIAKMAIGGFTSLLRLSDEELIQETYKRLTYLREKESESPTIAEMKNFIETIRPSFDWLNFVESKQV